ncbi:molecular chaperone HtpG [Pontibacter sp. G13]|uniref:molecular chaperone HtpG n=1 Tax=Pontibacter sp. G13 TaxID=3074898 RepID=UPI00288C2E05|nr:molecular chaperone HtpG [Pontibacter sp. G13]WNJ16126.1 molecular chaperone HtpG [Pontibacter sp. G13]
MEKGTISVSTENIFPIIKKYLYSDHEIFLRELVSNAVDASQKMKHLSSLGEFTGELGDLKVTVSIDKENKTLTISDMGIGMTADEMKKYLNQVAFSGAEEFIKKFKEAGEAADIIGKFGLGFYSAFMVSDLVEVVSKSYQEGAEAVKWTCDGTTTYTIDSAERESRGTDIILHINEESQEFLESARIRTILEKYAKFLPIPVEFEGESLTNPNPAWKKSPSELTDEDYISFFKELYPYDEDPLFWIHLNVDYPFTLTGILYFPKIRQDIDPRKSKIQLYARQVFITDEVGEIVPDYLMLLQGVIDSPDIPLNVSRSYLQSDGNVKKISNYITKKVADKLLEIYRDDRGTFEEKWNDISVFVKYGMLTDEKFYDKAIEFSLLQNMDGNFFNLEEYRAKIQENQTDKQEQTVFLYTTDENSQDFYIRSAQAKGYDVLKMEGIVDSHYIGLLERKNDKDRWIRVDSDTVDKLIVKEDAETSEDGLVLTEDQESKIKESFVRVADDTNKMIQLERLGADQLPVMITRPEFMRRMRDMAATQQASGMDAFPDSLNVIVNSQHPLVVSMVDSDQPDEMAKQLMDLALLSQNMLTGKALTDFIHRSVDMLEKK